MCKLTIALSFALAAPLLAGCGDSKLDPTGPTVQTTTLATQSPSISVTPSTLFAEPVADAVCPNVAPFSVRFNLSVRAGSTSVFITDLAMRFVDSHGAQMPQVTLTAPLPATQFGTALVEARTLRAFPMSFPIGCGTGRDGNLILVIGTRDGDGHTSSTRLTAPVH